MLVEVAMFLNSAPYILTLITISGCAAFALAVPIGAGLPQTIQHLRRRWRSAGDDGGQLLSCSEAVPWMKR